VAAACGGDLRGRTIAILGLTFKPNTDDMREAPSLALIQALQDAGARVNAYDPEGMEGAKALLDRVHFGRSPYDIAEGADALVIVTEWDAFRALDLDRLGNLMTARVFVDLRNIYTPEDVEKHGFTYTSIGRPPALTST
jgi:UDPglucose 6-dehydrogenase